MIIFSLSYRSRSGRRWFLHYWSTVWRNHSLELSHLYAYVWYEDVFHYPLSGKSTGHHLWISTRKGHLCRTLMMSLLIALTAVKNSHVFSDWLGRCDVTVMILSVQITGPFNTFIHGKPEDMAQARVKLALGLDHYEGQLNDKYFSGKNMMTPWLENARCSTGPWRGEPPVIGGFPSQRASDAER